MPTSTRRSPERCTRRRARQDSRISAVDTGTSVLAVEDRPAQRTAPRCSSGARGGYLATSGPDGVVLHALPSGTAAVTLPVREPIWRLAMSGDGRVVAVASQHRVSFWSLTREP
jgi:hypothetical protein